jgi:predicted acyl esterase
MAFETGTNVWRRLPAWPAGCASGCSVKPAPLYLASGRRLDFAAPKSGDTAFDEYVSDPEKPVPFQARPILQSSYDDGKSWREWLVSDQREASGRPDVAVFVSDVLAAPVKISGQPVVNLVASTSGTDTDWVVKVIDVYPDEVAGQPAMGGYQPHWSRRTFSAGATGRASRRRKRSHPGSPCLTASRCRRRTMSSCRATG